MHREDMTATLGEVLEAEHVEEAIELLYKQDELSGNSHSEAPAAEEPAQGMDAHAREELVQEEAPRVEAEPPRDEPREQPPQHAREADEEDEPEAERPHVEARFERDRVAPRKRKGVLRFLSPSFMIGATMSATGAIVGGVRRAYRDASRDLRDAADKARHAFGGT